MAELALVQDEEMRAVLDLVQAGPIRAYIAGGHVRDWLMGRPGKDIDLCLEWQAISTARRVANATGGAFYVLDQEMDAARILYPRRDIVIDFAGLRGRNIVEDLRSRDLTVNAMGIALEDMRNENPTVLDPCAGRLDLAAGVLRATSEHAFRDDPVRLLRAVRLESTLPMLIEPQTEAWMRRDAALLVETSAERIRQELLLILGTEGVSRHVMRLQDLGLLGAVLPEVSSLCDIHGDGDKSSTDCLDFTLQSTTHVERLTRGGLLQPEEQASFGPYVQALDSYLGQLVCDRRTRGLMLILATLLHHVGYPGPCSTAGQPVRGAGDEAANVLLRLRFSSREVALVRSTVANAPLVRTLAENSAWDRRELYRYFRKANDAVLEPILLAWADYLAERETRASALQRVVLPELISELLGHYFDHPEQLVRPPALATGGDVMDWLGLEPGPIVGSLLEQLREEQATGAIRNHEQAEAYLRAARV
jgi:poly(A) polymerase